MKIFIFLDDCLLGENTLIELFFIYCKKHTMKDIINVLWNWKSIKQTLLKEEKNMKFANLFLAEDVLKVSNEYIKIYPDAEVKIVTDLEHVPISDLELHKEATICNKIQMAEDIKNKEQYILVTGNLWSNIRFFFKAIKTVFVGPIILGKIINLFNVGRTIVINRSYGVLTVIWDYFFNVLNNIFVFWPLLFFLPSTSFDLWKYAFFFNIIIGGFANLWRHFLELENERSCVVEGKELLFGGNFILLHHSTFISIIVSLILLFLTIIFGFHSLNALRALIFSIIYNIILFFFIARSNKEYVIAKLLVTILLPLIIQPTLLPEMIMSIAKY